MEEASPVSLELAFMYHGHWCAIFLLCQAWELQNSQNLSYNFCNHSAPGLYKALSCSIWKLLLTEWLIQLANSIFAHASRKKFTEDIWYHLQTIIPWRVRRSFLKLEDPGYVISIYWKKVSLDVDFPWLIEHTVRYLTQSPSKILTKFRTYKSS